MKVAILGSTGMLGSMVRRYLSEQPNYELFCPSRQFFDAESFSLSVLAHMLSDRQYVINCIGVIKPRIDEADPVSVIRAIQINSVFPHLLAHAAEQTGCKVLQIATDCVFSGDSGPYFEGDVCDAADVYGKTKSLGEVRSPSVYHLRCSIIGPELKGRHFSLLEWFLGQPQGATVKGFTNHRWNGITTLHFAKICHAIMSKGISLPSMLHVVPENAVSKAELLSYFMCSYNHSGVTINPIKAPVSIDRTLATRSFFLHRLIWQAAGYSDPPRIREMIEELVAYSCVEVPAQ